MTAPTSGFDGGGGTYRPAGPLAGRTFVAERVREHGADRPIVPGTTVTLSFGDDAVSVSGGCNTLSAGLDLTPDGRLELGPIASTMIACDAPREEQDAWVAAFLAAGPRWSADAGRLTLATEDATVELVAVTR